MPTFSFDSSCTSVAFLRKILELQQKQVSLYDAHLQWLLACPDSASQQHHSADCLEVVNKPYRLSNGSVFTDATASRPAVKKEVSLACISPAYSSEGGVIVGRVESMPMKSALLSPTRYRNSFAQSVQFGNSEVGSASASVTSMLQSDVICMLRNSVWGLDRQSGIPEAQAHRGLPLASEMLYFILLMQGGLPSSFILSTWRRRLHKIYKCLIIFSFLHVGLAQLGHAIMSLYAGLFPVEFCFFFAFAVDGTLGTIAAWRLLDAHGAYMEFMHQATQRGFDWKVLWPFTYVWMSIATCFSLCAPAFYSILLIGPGLGSHWEQQWNATPPAFANVLNHIGWYSLPSWSLCVFVGLSALWISWMFGELHNHDLLCYSAAVSTALEVGGNHEYEQPIDILKKLESTVAARLRHANRTWICLVMVFICSLVSMAIVCASFLLAAESDWTSRILPAAYIAVSCVVTAVLLTGMARISETFEYDVLFALNNPLVLQKAQTYFGQQILPHLHTLDWGFRFGGSVISPKYVNRIISGMALSACSTISVALMRKI